MKEKNALPYGAPFRTKVFENQNSCRESDKTIRGLEFMSRISNRSIRESEFMSRIGQNYSRKKNHVENRTKLFENKTPAEAFTPPAEKKIGTKWALYTTAQAGNIKSGYLRILYIAVALCLVIGQLHVLDK